MNYSNYIGFICNYIEMRERGGWWKDFIVLKVNLKINCIKISIYFRCYLKYRKSKYLDLFS